MEKRPANRIKSSDFESENSTLVFGLHSIQEVFNAGKTFEKLFFQKNAQGTQPLIKIADELNIPYSIVPPEKMFQFTRKNHQGVVGFTSPITYGDIQEVIIDTFEKGQQPFILVLDRITDVRNLGAIARTAECAGVHAILIPTRGAAQVSSDAIKTSSGAIQHIPICRSPNLKSTLLLLKENGIQIVACTEKSTTSIYSVPLDFSSPVAIIMGSEEEGVSQEYLKLCDEKVFLPMYGKISSLNVSAAAAICMYEIVRRRL